MTNECAEYLNRTAGRWDNSKSDAVIADMASRKMYVVAYVDCDDVGEGGKARVLGAFKSKDDAKAYVRNDMEDRCDQLAGCDITVDFDEMKILNSCEDTICNWNIEEIEVK